MLLSVRTSSGAQACELFAGGYTTPDTMLDEWAASTEEQKVLPLFAFNEIVS